MIAYILMTGWLAACTVSEATPEPTSAPVPIETTQRASDTNFEDVLAEYQALNRRLARVAAPLRVANADLCPETVRDPGFTTHRLEDYPAPLQPVAEALLGVERGGLFVRAVRPGTSAAEQRLEAGDRITSVNGNPISPDRTMRTYNRAVIRNGFDSVLSKVGVRTPQGRDYIARIRPQTACDIPAKVIYSDDVNGHTDGEEVLITSALMRAVPDDTNLALVIAHEMAHVIAGHREKVPTQALELEADRMALVLMARAGYDVEAAVAFWDEADHPHEGGSRRDSSHPRTQERAANFRAELARIQGVEGELGFGK